MFLWLVSSGRYWTWLEQISHEKVNLKCRLEKSLQDQLVNKDLNRQVEEIREKLQMTQSIFHDISKENQKLRAKLEQYEQHKVIESEELKVKFNVIQQT